MWGCDCVLCVRILRVGGLCVFHVCVEHEWVGAVCECGDCVSACPCGDCGWPAQHFGGCCIPTPFTMTLVRPLLCP